MERQGDSGECRGYEDRIECNQEDGETESDECK
jgi:hypothetical protein